MALKTNLHGCRSCDFDVCESCSKHEFDGNWVTSAGQSVVISGPCIQGSLSLFRSDEPGTCSMDIQGAKYAGKLSSNGRIEWSDGDVWIRGTHGPRDAGAADDSRGNAFEEIKKEPPQPEVEVKQASTAPPPARSLPRAPPIPEVLPPKPIQREKHKVAPQWNILAEDEAKIAPPSGASVAPPPRVGGSLPPPPGLGGSPKGRDRV